MESGSYPIYDFGQDACLTCIGHNFLLFYFICSSRLTFDSYRNWYVKPSITTKTQDRMVIPRTLKWINHIKVHVTIGLASSRRSPEVMLVWKVKLGLITNRVAHERAQSSRARAFIWLPSQIHLTMILELELRSNFLTSLKLSSSLTHLSF